MARLIDADALYETVSEHVTEVSVCPTVDWARGKKQMKEICLEDIANAPTVEIPLQCKTCTWFELDDAKWQEGTCTYWHGRIAADGYCSEGAWTGK